MSNINTFPETLKEDIGFTKEANWKELFTTILKRDLLINNNRLLNETLTQPKTSPPTHIKSEIEYISKESFKQSGFLLNEHWDNTFYIHARVIEIYSKEVICECLIDPENNVFENRSFEKLLFGNVDQIGIGTFVLLTIQTKKGSSRIDIHKGKGIVNEEKFSLFDQLKSLEGLGLDDPLIYD